MFDYRKRGHWLFDKKEDDEFIARQRREEIEAMKQAAKDELAKITQSKGVTV
jgi:hypothetical protein